MLALEIGSAYAIQVALLQIPALVAFSAIWLNYGVAQSDNSSIGLGQGLFQVYNTFSNYVKDSIKPSALKSEFTLVFPQQEFYCIIISVFLCKYSLN